jgi:beta-lactamase class D
MKIYFAYLGVLAAVGLAMPAQAKTICTVVADAATGTALVEQGNCAERYTPASTF